MKYTLKPLTMETAPLKGSVAGADCESSRGGEVHQAASLTVCPSVCCRWADNFVAEGCGGSQEHSFTHPFVQVPALSSCPAPRLYPGTPAAGLFPGLRMKLEPESPEHPWKGIVVSGRSV